MATPTYTPIASITLGSSASSVTFSSIPQDYRDLVLVIDATASASVLYWIDRINGTFPSAPLVYMRGTGSTAQSSASTPSELNLSHSGDPALQSIIQIMDYSATDKHKSFLIRSNYSSGYTLAQAARWPNTSAITSLRFGVNTGTYNAGSTFNLYGIAA